MVEFKWIITEEGIRPDVEDNYGVTDEIPYLDGWFEMILNGKRVIPGFPLVDEALNHTVNFDIPPSGDYISEWFEFFFEVMNLNPYQTVICKPVDTPVLFYQFARETETLQVSQLRNEEEIAESKKNYPNSRWNGPEEWSETVSYDEFCQECKDTIRKCLEVVFEVNPQMRNNSYMKKLSERLQFFEE